MISSRGFASGPLVPTLLGAVGNTVSLSLFIFAAGPVSGGHMNPLITISTFFGGLSTLPRTVLYVSFQVLGSTIAGFLIRAALGHQTGAIPGCYMEPSLVTAGQAVVFETMSSMVLVFLAFGVGLDPRQKMVFGAALGPILIGIALGLCTFATGSVKNGYTGAAMNPGRCFGLMAAAGRWDLHWVHWVGAVFASAINGVFYYFIPPTLPNRKRKHSPV